LRRGVKLETAIAEDGDDQKPGLPPPISGCELRDDHRVVQVERYGDSLIDTNSEEGAAGVAGGGSVLWLIASVNATNLLLGAEHGAAAGDCDARRAGASRGRVMQQMIVEGLGAERVRGRCWARGWH